MNGRIKNFLANLCWDISGALHLRKKVECPCEFCSSLRKGGRA